MNASTRTTQDTMSALRKRPQVATNAPDTNPTSLPPATLKTIADATARGEYLQEVNCYWNPIEVTELQELAKGLGLTVRDMRLRHKRLTVADLPTKEIILLNLEAKTPTFTQAVIDAEKAFEDVKDNLRQRGVDYFDRKKLPEYIEAERDYEIKKRWADGHNQAILNLEAEIKATKEWKPQRRIIVSFSYNDHITDSTITKIDTLKETCRDLCPKLIEVIKMRKTIMAEMNKHRDNPMRNVYLNFNLTPMDYSIQASWVITRTGKGVYDWNYSTYYLHVTEYDLWKELSTFGAYTSKEQQMIEEQKKQAVENKKRLTELKKTPYDDYFLIRKSDIGFTLKNREYNIDDLINDEDWYESTRLNAETKTEKKYRSSSIYELVVTNVTANTFTIIGYMVYPKEEIPYIKKSKIQRTITYPTQKRAKTTKLQKDLKKLTQNYEIPK